MAKHLTAASVEKLKPDPVKRREIPDGRLPGFYLVIQPSGKKSWAVRYRHRGVPRKYTLEGFPELAKARKLAQEALDAVAEGRDPAAEKEAARAAARSGEADRDRFDVVARQFIDRYARPKNRSWVETARLLGLRPDPENSDGLVTIKGGLVERWGERNLPEIRKRDVIDLLDGIVDGGAPMTANRTLAALRKLFNWAIGRDIIAASPCAGVQPPAAETSRDRILKDDEIRWLWKATGEQGYPFGPLVKLLILTGQRRDEVAGMAAGELKLADRLWTIPRDRAKNNEAHDVPLSDAALAIINALPKIAGRPGYLFTVTGETHVSGYSRAKANLDRAMLKVAKQEAAERGGDIDAVEIPRWTLHDLRRTLVSGMARLGINQPVIEKIINHRSGSFRGVVGVYQRHDFADEKRTALEAWSRFVAALVEGKPADNVVSLQTARA